ncbi:MAG: hypothetical protein WCE44_14715 [Candidatus Velthaea sp.]
MSDQVLEIQAAADDLRAAFPTVAYVQRNAVKLATVALRRVQATEERYALTQLGERTLLEAAG